jgi:predicted RNase H-like HicB family nuclease
MTHHFTAVIHEEAFSTGEPVFVAQCLELDITSQGETKEEAFANVQEAVELFLEDASDEELNRRLASREMVREFEVAA